jgi:hypothetical protein
VDPAATPESASGTALIEAFASVGKTNEMPMPATMNGRTSAL